MGPTFIHQKITSARKNRNRINQRLGMNTTDYKLGEALHRMSVRKGQSSIKETAQKALQSKNRKIAAGVAAGTALAGLAGLGANKMTKKANAARNHTNNFFYGTVNKSDGLKRSALPKAHPYEQAKKVAEGKTVADRLAKIEARKNAERAAKGAPLTGKKAINMAQEAGRKAKGLPQGALAAVKGSSTKARIGAGLAAAALAGLGAHQAMKKEAAVDPDSYRKWSKTMKSPASTAEMVGRAKMRETAKRVNGKVKVSTAGESLATKALKHIGANKGKYALGAGLGLAAGAAGGALAKSAEDHEVRNSAIRGAIGAGLGSTIVPTIHYKQAPKMQSMLRRDRKQLRQATKTASPMFKEDYKKVSKELLENHRGISKVRRSFPKTLTKNVALGALAGSGLGYAIGKIKKKAQ